jgi:hypothetical protein
MNKRSNSRRRFLKGCAVPGLTSGSIPLADAQGNDALARGAYGTRSRYVTSGRISDEVNCDFGRDCNTLTPLQDSVGMLTPATLHFNSSHGAHPPDINPNKFELLSFSYQEAHL